MFWLTRFACSASMATFQRSLSGRAMASLKVRGGLFRSQSQVEGNLPRSWNKSMHRGCEETTDSKFWRGTSSEVISSARKNPVRAAKASVVCRHGSMVLVFVLGSFCIVAIFGVGLTVLLGQSSSPSVSSIKSGGASAFNAISTFEFHLELSLPGVFLLNSTSREKWYFPLRS